MIAAQRSAACRSAAAKPQAWGGHTSAVPTLAPPKTRSPALASLGHFLRAHRRGVVALQWVVVAFYAVLIVVPPLLPLLRSGARILSDLTLFAQFAFWGIWWPFVIASTMLFGRAWCGLFCPEGTLTEFASRHGLGRAFPHWMHWGGWPFAACPGTTIYGQLVSVYDYPQAVLLVLGGWTLAAVGLSMLTLTQLRAEHVTVHPDALRAALLACALAWSAWLGARILWRGDAVRMRRAAAVLLYAVPLVLTGGAWWLVFWRW